MPIMFQKKDITVTAIVGVFTALIWTGVFIRLGTFNRFNLGNAIWGLVVVAPIIFVFGLYLGQWLSRWKSFFSSFARFVIIGFLNAGVDFGVFNLLIFLTGIEIGWGIALFKTASFLAAFTSSYFWNKYWTFGAGKTANRGAEFIKYTAVTLVGALINIGASFTIINFVTPAFGFSQLGWDNIAVVMATIGNLLWNFIMYNWVVFKTQTIGPEKNQENINLD